MGESRHDRKPLPRRRSVRLKEYDYGQAGAYFVTVCAHARACLFRNVGARRAVPGWQPEIVLNDFGRIVVSEWLRTASVRPHVRLADFVVMPNHFHAIVIFRDGPGMAPHAPAPEGFGNPRAGTLPTVLRSFKSAVAREINELRGTPGEPVWQRGY